MVGTRPIILYGGELLMALFEGSGVAIVTPFDEDTKINYTAYEKLVNFQIENGSDAIIVSGTTGESSTLSYEEKIELVRFTVEIVKKRVPVIGGAGSNNTAHSVDLCRGVQEAGADACLVVTPYYNKTTQKGLIQHYKTIANAVDLPIILYSVQSRTGMNITAKTALELSKVENIVAIKEASGNISQVAEIAELCGDSLDIYCGNDDQIVPILSLGGKGVISVLANIAPRQVHEIARKYLDGDMKESLKLQIESLGVIRGLFKEVNPIPVKTALNLMDMDKGILRLPLIEMDELNKNFLIKEMKSYGLI